MNFKLSALGAFRTAKFDGETAIANLGKDNTVVQNGTYRGALGKIFRSSTTRAANNAVRTELLCSLGNSFGLDGIGCNEKGVVTFSKDFMDRLEKLLGPAFKREDFGVGRDGTVSSGKPLTQRRITAIIKQAVLVGKGEYDHDTYKEKLDYVKGKLAELPQSSGHVTSAIKHFEKVEKLMTFVKRELPGLIEDNFEYDKSKPESDDNAKYVLKDIRNYSESPLRSISRVSGYMQEKVGELFHISENILGADRPPARYEELTDPKAQITDYLDRVCKSFIMTSVDLFLDAEKAGKLDDFVAMLGGTWPCIEGKTSGLTEFRIQHIPMDDAGPVATHDADQPLNQCIGREISAIVGANPENVGEWKDIAAQVKKNLVGVIRPIDVPEVVVSTGKDGEEIVEHKFKPLLGATGKPVVRAITEADIDAIGEAVMDTILYG